MDTPETVSDAVRLLQSRGFDDGFTIEAKGVRCPTCGRVHPAASLDVTDVFRFEGPSDPGDEAIVLGVRCSSCGSRGIVVSAYGPDADDRLRALAAEHERRRP